MLKTEPDNTIRIVQITDPHLFGSTTESLLGVNTAYSFQGVVRHIKQQQTDIDLILATGDIAHNSQPAAYGTFFEGVKGLAPVIRSLPGNHDQSSLLGQQWETYSQPLTRINNWLIVTLDSTITGSNNGRLGAEQLKLLQNACNSHKNQHVLVALHHNPIAMQSQWLDTMMVANSTEFMNLISKHENIKVVLWGHVHQEHDQIQSFSEQHQVRLLACPSTSIQFKPQSQKFALDDKDPGYRILELKEDGTINTQVVRVSGLDIQPELKSHGY